jgi:hypothetical protein
MRNQMVALKCLVGSVAVSQGLYRAGPTARGLPLPRTALGVFTATVIAAAVLAAFVPWVLLFARGPAHAWSTFRDGGGGMWVLALLDFALPVALGIAGAVVVRGKRVPSGLFFGVAAIPFFASVLFAYLSHLKVEGALAAGAIEASQVVRIQGAGLAEALSLDQFGGFVTCGSALVGALALSGAVASIDVAAATRSGGERPSSVLGAAALVAGTAWFGATLVLTALRIKNVGAICIWVVFSVALLVPFAVFAARAAPVLRGWHDPIEARKASGGLLVAGLAAMFAVLVLERAMLARTASIVFGAVSSESVDPSQRARILMELVDARKWTSIAYVIHGILGTATFGLAVAASVGVGRRPISPSVVMAASVGVFVLAATFVLGVVRTRSIHRAAEVRNVPEGITLPRVEARMDEGKNESTSAIVLKRDGSNAADPLTSITCARHGAVSVFADGMATLEMLAKHVPSAPPCAIELLFVAAAEKDRALEARLGDLAPFARGDLATISVTYDLARPGYLPSTGYLTVRALEDETIEYEGNRVRLPLGAGSPDLRAGKYELVRYVFKPNDTIGHVVRVVAAVKDRFKSRLEPFGAAARLEIEWPPPPPPDPAVLGPGVRLGTPIISPELSAETITRIFRQNRKKLLQCYETGLANDPKLAGTVVVKLALDRRGMIKAAHAEATPKRNFEVARCMTRAFYDVSFPPPEGDVGTIRYPIELGP